MANTQSKEGKNFNPTITALFRNEKFGDGSYLSADIDAKAYDTIMKSVAIGSKLLFKKSRKVTEKGTEYGFLEVLPPREGDVKPKRAKRDSDDI